MIPITTLSTSIYFCTRPTDMRKAYDGLCGEVVSFMKQEPTSGHLFVFVNKRRDRMKILVWDRHGFWLLCKRLEAGRFQLPALHDPAQRSAVLSPEQMLMVLEGIDLNSVRLRRRYRRIS
jgi:transposase